MNQPTSIPDEASFPLGQYEAALKKLSRNASDRRAQHQAVLSLARLGATDLALSEYAIYGLDAVKDDEDIIALKARLFKDLYIQNSGQTALNYAIKSAEEYERAYQATHGFYSAINAATMGYLSGDEASLTRKQCKALLDSLPSSDKLTRDEHYFVEATRAEAFLLLGDDILAERALSRAFSFDPLNYAAHATTLRQFKLIEQKQGRAIEWLEAFSAPATLHFAGHLWQADADLDEAFLKIELSDKLQRHDIGFAYGALAAGADIVMAEACLAEGVALHVVLPMQQKQFENSCLRPFGETWVRRFRICLKRAYRVDVISFEMEALSEEESFLLGSEIAMGQAILRARDYERTPHQFLMIDEKRENSQTDIIGRSWSNTGFSQTRFPLNLSETQRPRLPSKDTALRLCIHSADSVTIESVNRAHLFEAIQTLKSNLTDRNMFVTWACGTAENPVLPETGQIFLCDKLAALLALDSAPDNHLDYAGLTGRDNMTHWYRLRS